MIAAVHIDIPGPALAQAATTSLYAGFWRRAVATAVDGILVLALVVGLAVAVGSSVAQVNGDVVIEKHGQRIPLSAFAKPRVVVTDNGSQRTTVETTTATIGLQEIESVVTRTHIEQNGVAQSRVYVSSSLRMYPAPLALALFAIVWLLLTSLLDGSRLQGTPGKLVMFICVVDRNGHRLTPARALARNALKLVSAAPLGVGFLLAGLTDSKQALHDTLTNCTVQLRV